MDKKNANTKPPNGIPAAAEFGLLRAYLAQNGYTQVQIKTAIGATPNKRTRAQITDDLTNYIKSNL